MNQISSVSSSSARNSGESDTGATQYTVHKGDNLSDIASRHGVSLSALQNANPDIAAQRFIFAGDKLTIPSQHSTTHTVSRGETLTSIAAANNTSVKALMNANPQIRNANQIYPGDVVKIAGATQNAPTAKTPVAGVPVVQNPVPAAPAGKTQTSSETSATSGVITPGRASIRAADLAENRAGPTSKKQCYAWVKRALQDSGAVSRYLVGVPAKGAGPELAKEGYVNVLGKPGYNIKSPYDAPKGAVLVYGAAPGATDGAAKWGHIEIRTSSGFASDYKSPRARTGPAENGLSGKGRVLIGVYIKPDAGAKPVQVPINVKSTISTSSLPADKAETYQRVGNIISHGEGGYESYNAGTLHSKVIVSRIKPPAGTVTNKTINEIIATQSLSPTDPNRLFATGKYQTIIPTLKSAKAAMGLTGNERYTPAMQERIFREYLIGKAGGGKLEAFINQGKGTVETAQYAAAKEWASIAVPEGLPINGYTDKEGQYHPGPISNGRMSYYESKANHANMDSTNQLRIALQQIDASRANAK
jgi:LysM repeat protein